LDSILANKKVQFVVEAGATAICGIKMKYDMCWGIVNAAGDAIVANLLEFLLEKNYFCEFVAPVCRKQHYERLESDPYI